MPSVEQDLPQLPSTLNHSYLLLSRVSRRTLLAAAPVFLAACARLSESTDNLQATIVAQRTEIAQLRAPNETPKPQDAQIPTLIPIKLTAAPAQSAEIPSTTPTAQIPAIPWAQISLGGLIEGQTAVQRGGTSGDFVEPDKGFKWIAAYLWAKNLTSQWQTFGVESEGGLPQRVMVNDSEGAEQRVTLAYFPPHWWLSSGQTSIPPKAAVRFHVLAQIPAMRQPRTLTLQFQRQQAGGSFQLTVPFAEGKVPTGLFEREADFPSRPENTTLVCVRDRSIAMKFRNVDMDQANANFDLLIHNSSGATIHAADYYIGREAWSASGIFNRTPENWLKPKGDSVPPDQDGRGSTGVFLPDDFGSGTVNKRGVVSFPMLVRLTIYPSSQRQPNQPACEKKEMLFRIDKP